MGGQLIEKQSAGEKKDKEVAETSNEKLVDEGSRTSIIGVLAKKKLAGWEANTLKNNLREAQYADDMLSLPSDHLAFIGCMSESNESFWLLYIGVLCIQNVMSLHHFIALPFAPPAPKTSSYLP